MNRLCFAAFFLVGLCLWHGFSGAEDRLLLQDESLTIVYDKPLDATAKHLLKLYPSVKDELETALEWKLQASPTVVLSGNREAFEKMSGSASAAAFALPQRSLVVLYASPGYSTAYRLVETFNHELCHLLLHENIPQSRLPRWLDEGICQWISGTIGELLVGPDQLRSVRTMMVHRPIPFSRIERTFPQEPDLLLLAYEQSRSFVTYIASRYGRDQLLGILRSLKGGRTVEQAFQENLYRPLTAVEREWMDRQGRRSRWVIWSLSYLYEILFFLSALAAVYAFLRIRRRRLRELSEADDESDQEE